MIIPFSRKLLRSPKKNFLKHFISDISLLNMLNNQDSMELGSMRNDAGILDVNHHQGISRKGDEDRLIKNLTWEHHDYYDHDHAEIHLQIVPEIRKGEEEMSKQDLFVVPDEHSETGEHHNLDKRRLFKNKHNESKRRRIQVSSDDESREVPTLTRKGYKRRRRHMSEKMCKLQKLLPNCYKRDKVSVLDKAIEYMKSLQLQIQVMSMMGMNPYFPPATLHFGMHNHMLTSTDVAHGLNPANQTASSLLFPVPNWSLPHFTYPLFLHSLASSPHQEHLYGLAPCFPSCSSFYAHTMGRL